MSAGEDGVGADALPFVIGGKRLQLVAPIWNGTQQPPHPLSVLLEGPRISERFGLRGECRIRLAVLLASLPSFPSFAGLEEFHGNTSDRRHGSRSSSELLMSFYLNTFIGRTPNYRGLTAEFIDVPL